ncbi:MAG: hypothetical protein ACI80I_000711 [Akkermansiaceae bacterium]
MQTQLLEIMMPMYWMLSLYFIDLETVKPKLTGCINSSQSAYGHAEAICLIPPFDDETQRPQIEGMKSSRWRLHLDEKFVKTNWERHYPKQGQITEAKLESFLSSMPVALEVRNVRTSFQLSRNQ